MSCYPPNLWNEDEDFSDKTPRIILISKEWMDANEKELEHLTPHEIQLRYLEYCKTLDHFTLNPDGSISVTHIKL